MASKKEKLIKEIDAAPTATTDEVVAVVTNEMSLVKKEKTDKTEKKASVALKIEKNIPFIAQANIRNIIIFGCGGTGSHVIPQLMRLIASKKEKAEYKIQFIDGDIVEDKNLIRQHFIQSDVNKNKAEALASRYSAAFGLPISFRDKYVETAAELEKIMFDGTNTPLIVSCVDNVKSRALIKEVLEQTQTTAYWVDCGNEDSAGQVVVSARVPEWRYQDMSTTGKFPLPDVFDIYPDLINKVKTDKFASELSCAELAVSSPQHGFVNLTAATLALNFIFSLIQRTAIYSHVVEFSIKNKYAHKPLNASTILSWKDKMFLYRGATANNIK